VHQIATGAEATRNLHRKAFGVAAAQFIGDFGSLAIRNAEFA
jgi:hypothetical protein